MTTAHTIESFFALINSTAKARAATARQPTAGCPVTVRNGATLRLPTDRRVTVITGRLWLTHRGDRRDHFPRAGDSFDTVGLSDSVAQALGDATLLIE